MGRKPGKSLTPDSTAKELVSLIPSVTPLLVSETADTVQHGLLGFLRNLSVLEANRPALFEAGVIDRLVEMGVWTSERDRMGSVQGGAIVILKNLCRAREFSFVLTNGCHTLPHRRIAKLMFSRTVACFLTEQNGHYAVARPDQEDGRRSSAVGRNARLRSCDP